MEEQSAGFSETTDMLTEWGKLRSIRDSYKDLSYRSLLGVLTKKPGCGPAISDDMANIIDYLVCRLRQKKPLVGDAITLHFQKFMTRFSVGEELGVSRKTAGQYIDEGIAWIDAGIEIALTAANEE